MIFSDLKTLTVPNIVFVIVLAIGGSYLTFLTAKGGLTNNTYRRWWKRITKRGRIVLCLSLFMLITLVLQESNTQRVNNQKDDLLTNERNGANNKIATGIERGVDSSNRKLFSDLSKAFAKQNLQFDTLKKTVERIKDSVKGITNNYPQPDPIVGLDSNAIQIITESKDALRVEINITSKNAGSTNFKIAGYTFTEESNEVTTYAGNNVFIDEHLSLASGEGWKIGCNIGSVHQLQGLYFYFKGTYTTLDGSKKYPIDVLYSFDLSRKFTVEVIGSKRSQIISLIPKVTR